MYSLVTDFVPSEMACLASSPGRMSLTEVWISRDEIVDFFEYDASSDVSSAFQFQVQLQTTLTGSLSGNTLEDIVHE